MLSANTYASDNSYSVTIKPSASIAGTASFNIHIDNSVTVLVYESASKITENSVSIEKKKIAEVAQLLEGTLDEFLNIQDYSTLPEYKQISAISVTHNKVTKSISTRRYSQQLIQLIQAINQYFPKEHQISLQKK